MLSKKRLPLTTLISYVLSFTADNVNKNSLDAVFPTKIKSNDEFTFESLSLGESRNINDFPKKLKNIFDPFIKELNRHGSKKSYDEEHNISLYYSILSHLINNFSDLPEDDQYNYIKKLRDKLIIFVSSNDTFEKYKYDELGWVKKDILTSLAQFKLNKILLKLVADYLNLNIIMLNVIEDLIYIVSENDSYDMFRRNIILVYNAEEYFEPVTYSNTFLLDYNTGIIKKLITVDKNFLMLLGINLKDEVNTINFNIKLTPLEIKPDDKNNNHDITSDSSKKDHKEIENEYGEILPTESDANAYVADIESNKKKVTPSNQLVFNISSKMKLDELQNIAQKLNIDLEKDSKTKSGKKLTKTKTELISEINSMLKKK